MGGVVGLGVLLITAWGGDSVARAHSPTAPAGVQGDTLVGVVELRGDPESDDPVMRGAYLARAGNCVTCHTEEDAAEELFLAGGKPIETPFGVFYGTNITSNPEHGIGDWSEEDFARAMREGRAPDGSHYYPSFPYAAFTKMTDSDISDLYAFLREVPGVDRENIPHDIPWYAGFRGSLALWKMMNFEEGRFEPDPDRDEQWNRGAYLTRAVTHCAECHSPRTLSGGIDEGLRYAGTSDGPDGGSVPNITPHETGIGGWSARHLVRYLEFGMDPDGDFAGGSMADVISEGTSYLTGEDLAAIVDYLSSLDPIENEID